MKHIKFTCDKCGKEIEDVVYTLTCYAENIQSLPFGASYPEVVRQNAAQNFARQSEDRHLCKACKDAITDGIFIL